LGLSWHGFQLENSVGGGGCGLSQKGLSNTGLWRFCQHRTRQAQGPATLIRRRLLLWDSYAKTGLWGRSPTRGIRCLRRAGAQKTTDPEIFAHPRASPAPARVFVSSAWRRRASLEASRRCVWCVCVCS
jgi:hypothetical protein